MYKVEYVGEDGKRHVTQVEGLRLATDAPVDQNPGTNEVSLPADSEHAVEMSDFVIG